MTDYIKREDETGYIKKADAIRMAIRESTECVTSDEYTEADSARVGEVVARIIYTLQTMLPADVAPVVRCEDCKFSELFQNDSSGVMARYCKAFTLERMVADNDFCSYGERKDK